MVSIDFRLKLRHWFRKYKKIVFIVVIVWGVIFTVNKYLIEYTPDVAPNTTYTPTVSVLDSGSSVPKKVQLTAEKMIEEYVGYCNEGNYQKAYNMLSEDCRKYGFDNNVEEFAMYVITKMPTKKQYSIQNYSNYDKFYIYEIKYIDDILSTGLTNQTYQYTTEKIVMKKNSDGTYDMATGNFISYDQITSVSENEYLKVDIKNRITRYSTETYEVKFTNRTDSTVVIADTLQNNEVSLVLTGEYRSMNNADTRIILAPGQSDTFYLTFTKFADDNDNAQSLLFGTIRVIENYKGVNGTEEEKKEEINNAIAKFSMQVPVR